MYDFNTVLQKFICTDRQHHRLLDKQASKGGLHRGQNMMLRRISECSSPPTQKELASFFEISNAATAVMLKKLEQGGYIVRKAQRSDMRINRITITEKGMEALNNTRRSIRTLDEQMFKDFSKEEFASLYGCLEKMQRNLTEFEINNFKGDNNEKMD